MREAAFLGIDPGQSGAVAITKAGGVCGARTRSGTPCQRRDLYPSGRCKLHGGLSTGPRTIEGIRRCVLNGLQPKRKKQTPWRG